MRVVPVRAGQANRERHAPPVADQMALAPALGPIGGIRTGLVTAVDRADGTTVHDRPRPINLVGAREPIQQRKVDQIPHARPLPIAQAPPARHPRPAPEFLREHLPGNAAAKDEDNAGQARAIRNARPATFGRRGRNRQERFDKIPQRDLEAAPRPYAVHATSPTRIRFGRFCYALLRNFVFFVFLCVKYSNLCSQRFSAEALPAMSVEVASSLFANELYRLDGSGCKAEREHNQGEGGEKLASAIERMRARPWSVDGASRTSGASTASRWSTPASSGRNT